MDIVYDHFIERIARMHYECNMKDFTQNSVYKTMKKRAEEYATDHEQHVMNLLENIGYSTLPNSNYSPFDEIMAIICRKPYFEYKYDIDDKTSVVQVMYYPQMMNKNVFQKLLILDDKIAVVTLNILTGKMMCNHNSGIKIRHISTFIPSDGYLISEYEVTC